MSVQISYRPARKMPGMRRYLVRFSSGMPVEFLIDSPRGRQTREWQVLFAESLRRALASWIEHNKDT